MSRRSVEPAAFALGGKRRLGRGAWLAAAVGAACFLNSLWNGLVYDDIPIVRDNPRIRSLSNVSDIWLTDWWRPVDPDTDVAMRRRDRLYRPLTMQTFALQYAIHEARPAGYHAVNVALHAAVCLLVWRLAQRLFDDTTISNLAALVFAVHPIHCEAVANVIGRAEVLAALFLLGGCLILLPDGRPPGWRRGALAGLVFLAALFCKETAICYVPVALLLMHAAAARPRQRPWRWWLTHAALLLAPLVIYLPLRYVALDQHLLRDLAPSEVMNPLVQAEGPYRALHAFTILGHYTRLLLAPVKLSCNYGLKIIDPHAGPGLMTFVGLVTALGLAVALVGYWKRAVLWRRLAVLTAAALASYVLVSNTVVLIGVSLAERLFYWPSVPILLALVVLVVHAWRWAREGERLSAEMPRVLRLAGMGLLAVLALRSVVRNFDWSSNLALFSADAAQYPGPEADPAVPPPGGWFAWSYGDRCVEINAALGNEILWEIRRRREGGVPVDLPAELKQADYHLGLALGMHPTLQSALQTRGRVYWMQGRHREAIAYLEEASQQGPLDRAARLLLTTLREIIGEDVRRLAEVEQQLTTRPTDGHLLTDYGEALLRNGRDKEALPQLEQAVRLLPDDARAWRLLGEALILRDEQPRALEALRRSEQLDPHDWRTQTHLSAMYSVLDPAACLRHAEAAYRLVPLGVVTNRHLAEALALNQRFEEAIERYRILLRGLTPDDPARPVIEQRVRELERAWRQRR